MSRSLSRRLPLFTVVGLFLAGCARTPPHLQPVEAETPMELTLWRAKMVHELTPEEWRWFDAVIQEHKLQLMREENVTGGTALDEAVRRKIDGRPLAEVMREGLRLQLRRQTAERDEMKTAFERNEEKRALVKPAQTDLLRDLDFHQDELRRKIARTEEDIAATTTALDAVETKSAR